MGTVIALWHAAILMRGHAPRRRTSAIGSPSVADRAEVAARAFAGVEVVSHRFCDVASCIDAERFRVRESRNPACQVPGGGIRLGENPICPSGRYCHPRGPPACSGRAR